MPEPADYQFRFVCDQGDRATDSEVSADLHEAFNSGHVMIDRRPSRG